MISVPKAPRATSTPWRTRNWTRRAATDRPWLHRNGLWTEPYERVFGYYQGSPQFVNQREYYKPTYGGGLRYTFGQER